LHPTSDEILKQLCPESDSTFLQKFNSIQHSVSALEDMAYSEDPSITLEQTMICLFRISELTADSGVDLEVFIPIIVYLQDKFHFEGHYEYAHLHSLYALQNTDFSDRRLLDDMDDGHTKIRMLFECHLENLYHLSKFQSVIECVAEYRLKFGHLLGCRSYRVHHLSFFANIQLKDFGDALDDISEAIALSPDSATLYNHRCFALCELGQFERALKDANQCLNIDPDHQIGLNNRGSVYNDLKQYELALIDLDRAIRIADGGSANAFRHRALAHYMLRHYDEAIEDVTTAIAMNHDYPEADELRLKIWNEIYDSARQGIDAFFVDTDLVFLEPLVHLVVDFVVGSDLKD